MMSRISSVSKTPLFEQHLTFTMGIEEQSVVAMWESVV